MNSQSPSLGEMGYLFCVTRIQVLCADNILQEGRGSRFVLLSRKNSRQAESMRLLTEVLAQVNPLSKIDQIQLQKPSSVGSLLGMLRPYRRIDFACLGLNGDWTPIILAFLHRPRFIWLVADGYKSGQFLQTILKPERRYLRPPKSLEATKELIAKTILRRLRSRSRLGFVTPFADDLPRDTKLEIRTVNVHELKAPIGDWVLAIGSYPHPNSETGTYPTKMKEQLLRAAIKLAGARAVVYLEHPDWEPELPIEFEKEFHKSRIQFVGPVADWTEIISRMNSLPTASVSWGSTLAYELRDASMGRVEIHLLTHRGSGD